MYLYVKWLNAKRGTITLIRRRKSDFQLKKNYGAIIGTKLTFSYFVISLNINLDHPKLITTIISNGEKNQL